MILLFLVRNQTITLVDTKVTPRQGSAEYLQLKFMFATSDWQDLRKTVYISAGSYSLPFELTSDTLMVPTYFTQQKSFNCTLLGDRGTQLVPTNVLTVSLDASNSLWTAQPPDPENSAYIQLLNSIGDLTALETQDKTSLVYAINELSRRSGAKPGATEEEAAQIAQNKADIERLDANKLDASKLPEVINDALAQAKESGEFDGDPGYTPVKGKDYYTEADKAEMVSAVIAALPVYDGEVIPE